MATNKNFEVKNGLSVGGTERISSAGAFAGSLASGVTATTQSAADSSTKIATTAYTDAAITALIGGAPSALNDLNELAAAIADDANYSTTLTTALATKLPLAGGTLTGNLTVPYLATTSYIDLNNSGNRGKIGWSGNHTYIATTSSVGAIIFKNNVGSTASPQTGGDTLLTLADGGNATFAGTITAEGNDAFTLDNGTTQFIKKGTKRVLEVPDSASGSVVIAEGFSAGTFQVIPNTKFHRKVLIGATSGEANLVVRDLTDGTHKGGRIGFGIHEAGALQIYDAVTMSKTAGSVVTDSTASGGENVTLSSGQLYGPYHTLPRGQYRLCVKMKTTNAAYTGDAARITLHTSSATVIPETRTVRGVDFGTNNKWQSFSVPFQVVGASTNAVEFYLFALNSQAISIDYFFIMNDTDSYSTKVYGDQIVDGVTIAKQKYEIGNHSANKEEFGVSAVNGDVDTAATSVNTVVQANENRSGVYWLNYNSQKFRAFVRPNWMQGRNWVLAAKFFSHDDMPAGSSLWTNDTSWNAGDFDLNNGHFSKYGMPWRYFGFNRLAMQMGNRVAPIMQFNSTQTLYGAFSGGLASNGGVTADSTDPSLGTGTAATYHAMTNYMGPNFTDLGGAEDRMQPYGLNKWLGVSSNSTSSNNQGSGNVHANVSKGFQSTVEDNHPNITGIDSIGRAGAWIGCAMDEGASNQANATGLTGADSAFGFGGACGNTARTWTSGYAEWARGAEVANLLPAYIWVSID